MPSHVIHAMRTRIGLNSPTSAVAFGMMEPIPMPPISLIVRSCVCVETCAVASVAIEKRSVPAMSIGRRPNRSASIVNESCPISKIAGAEHRTEASGLDAPLADQRGCHVAERLDGEAVHDHAMRAEPEDPQVERPDGAAVGDTRDFEDRRRIHPGCIMQSPSL